MAPHDLFGQNSTTSSLTFLCVKHDHNCLAILTQGVDDCTCEELEYELHSSPQRYIASIELGRTARRKAARDAAKTLRKAAHK